MVQRNTWEFKMETVIWWLVVIPVFAYWAGFFYTYSMTAGRDFFQILIDDSYEMLKKTKGWREKLGALTMIMLLIPVLLGTYVFWFANPELIKEAHQNLGKWLSRKVAEDD
jgi:hypothetical protein